MQLGVYFSIINYSQKIFYIKSAVLNMYKYFKDFKHFLPRERTLHATDHHRLELPIAEHDGIHSSA